VRRARYATLRRPWNVTLDARSRAARRFFLRIAADNLNHGFPAARSHPLIWKLLAANAPRAHLLGPLLRMLPRRRRPELDDLLDELSGLWDRLAQGSARLPAAPPPLHAVAMERRAGRTVIVLGDSPTPLLVAKLPRAQPRKVDHESRALSRAAPAGVSPRFLLTIGDARVQEALEGAPQRLPPLSLESAPRLEWPAHLDQLTEALSRLARETLEKRPPSELRVPIERALADAPINSVSRRLLSAAWHDVSRLPASVLRHGDTSPQNCLYSGGRLVGLIDWESAVFEGAPGFDALNAALAYLYCSLGLVAWSDDVAAEGFAAAWRESPFGRQAEASFTRLATDCGVPERWLESLEIAFFGLGLGRRLILPGPFVSGVKAWTQMLEFVCR
jgi:hypothetical protein